MLVFLTAAPIEIPTIQSIVISRKEKMEFSKKLEEIASLTP